MHPAIRSVGRSEVGERLPGNAMAVGAGPVDSDLVEPVLLQPADGVAVAVGALERPPGVQHELGDPAHLIPISAQFTERFVELAGLGPDSLEPLGGGGLGVGRAVGHPGLAVAGSQAKAFWPGRGNSERNSGGLHAARQLVGVNGGVPLSMRGRDRLA